MWEIEIQTSLRASIEGKPSGLNRSSGPHYSWLTHISCIDETILIALQGSAVSEDMAKCLLMFEIWSSCGALQVKFADHKNARGHRY